MSNIFSKAISYIKNFFGHKELSMQEFEATANVEIKYYLSDPSNPELIGTAINPQTYKLPFGVKYFNGKGAPFDCAAGQAANTYAVLCHGINTINKKAELSKWAVVSNLQVNPIAGIQANAYYDRQGLKFFYFQSGPNKVYTCLSADIVSHEMGHAFLDAMRPEFFSMANTEIWSFHESFGDCIAIFCSLAQPGLVDYVLVKTEGDLKKPNLIEGLAEQFGTSLNIGGALRKAFNSFVYVKPETLPKNAPNDQLANECHSFSRVMTGAFYDVLTATYDSYGRGKDAIAKTLELLLPTYIEANKKAPSSPTYYMSFSRKWMELVGLKNPGIATSMQQIFTARNIFPRGFDFENNLQSMSTEEGEINATVGSVKIANLFKNVVFAQENDKLNEILSLNVTCPCGDIVCLDDGTIKALNFEQEDALESAKTAVMDIVENDLYGPEEDKMWYKDEDGNLVRKFISCDGSYINNCLVPGNPEFGKCWKCKNNTGCCTYGSCGCEQKPQPKVIPTCNLRYNSCGGTRYNASCGFARYNENP